MQANQSLQPTRASSVRNFQQQPAVARLNSIRYMAEVIELRRKVLKVICVLSFFPNLIAASVIEPVRGSKIERVAGSDLSAPYKVESIHDGVATVDLGKTRPVTDDFKVMTFISGDVSFHGTIIRFDKVCEGLCETEDKVCHFVGLYKIQQLTSTDGFVGLSGNRKIEKIKKPNVSGDGNYNKFTIIRTGETVSLLDDGAAIMSATADYNEPKLTIDSEFTFQGKSYYLVTAGLKLEDTKGLLFRENGTWRFLYRTVEPSERAGTCGE